MRSSSGESLESILMEQLHERRELRHEIDLIRDRVTSLEEAMTAAKRHLGLVRYDAFEDVGGNQSFALALYDDRGNGAVITGIVGRAHCRVYCKPLLNGRSERDLSQEEQRAIREARSIGPKSIVSP